MNVGLELLERLRALEKKSNRVALYPPAELRMIMRTQGNLPGQLDPELVSLYGFTNGASILDYCVAGCKNRRIVDVATNTLELWRQNPLLAGRFVGFMLTSSGANFGYLSDFPGGNDKHPVAFFSEMDESGLLVLTTSVSRFLEIVAEEVELTLSCDSKALYIARENWPLDLGYWLARDPSLAELYKSGRLSSYLGSDRIREIVARSI